MRFASLGQLKPYAGLLVFAVALGLTLWRNGGIPSFGLADTLMWGLFVALMIWFLSPPRTQ